MLKFIKYALLLAAILLCYKGLEIYGTISSGKIMLNECHADTKLTEARKRGGSKEDVERLYREVFTCVKERQNFIQAYFFKVTDKMIHPEFSEKR